MTMIFFNLFGNCKNKIFFIRAGYTNLKVDKPKVPCFLLDWNVCMCRVLEPYANTPHSRRGHANNQSEASIASTRDNMKTLTYGAVLIGICMENEA